MNSPSQHITIRKYLTNKYDKLKWKKLIHSQIDFLCSFLKIILIYNMLGCEGEA